MLRFYLQGKHDSYICLAEEKLQDAKKITYVMGGWGGSKSSVAWREKG